MTKSHIYNSITRSADISLLVIWQHSDRGRNHWPRRG